LTYHLQRISSGEWRLWREVRLQALADAPYAFGSTLADWQDDGDTEQRWRTRLDDVAFNLVAVAEGRPVAQVSGTTSDERGDVELISMWVAPSARGAGLGDQLVAAVVDWAAGQGAGRVTLSVKRSNAHAIALYERTGFVPSDEPADEPDERRMIRRLR
jgi:GNAT superfamily N-acetyltransferase